jgi:hypothetical protein
MARRKKSRVGKNDDLAVECHSQGLWRRGQSPGVFKGKKGDMRVQIRPGAEQE